MFRCISCAWKTKKSEIYFSFLFFFNLHTFFMTISSFSMLRNSVAHFSIPRPEKSYSRRKDGNQAEYYAVASFGLIFFLEKNFHKEYIAVFACIRLEFSNTMFVSMCMCFYSERTASWLCPTLSFSISIFFLFVFCRF